MIVEQSHIPNAFQSLTVLLSPVFVCHVETLLILSDLRMSRLVIVLEEVVRYYGVGSTIVHWEVKQYGEYRQNQSDFVAYLGCVEGLGNEKRKLHQAEESD